MNPYWSWRWNWGTEVNDERTEKLTHDTLFPFMPWHPRQNINNKRGVTRKIKGQKKKSHK